MRINAGRFKGRAFAAPRGRDTRPTSDRTREAIFNVLAHGIDGGEPDGASVVDLFAGAGGLGLEALSRGAAHVTFVDSAGEALHAIKRNLAALGAAGEAALLKLDAARLPLPARIARAPMDLAFLDPPYGEGLAVPALLGLKDRGWLKSGAVCVVEVGAKEDLEPPRGYGLLDERTWGAAKVVFLRFGERVKA